MSRPPHNIDDLRITIEMPEPPSDLDGSALVVWQEFAPWLISVGPIERRVLARYCIATALWLRAVEEITKHGSVYTVRNHDGTRLAAVREMPHAAQVRSLEHVLRACEETLRPYLSPPASSSPLSSRSSDR